MAPQEPPVADHLIPVEVAASELVVRRAVYVPAYSQIYDRGKHRLWDLTVTLSIRNTDVEKAILLTNVSYYDTDGKLLRTFLSSTVALGPLATTEFIVEQQDRSGGTGGNFVVEWGSKSPVSAPLVETIMVSTAGQQGLSFTSRGIDIEKTPVHP